MATSYDDSPGNSVKEYAGRIYRWEYFWLTLIVIATLVLHFSLINSAKTPILDEQYYITDAQNITQNHETGRLEHPPLAKLLITGGIDAFGNNPWGWRVLPILFGTATILLFYLLCRRLNISRTGSSIAAFLLAFENLTFLMGSVAMLDVYYVTFMMAGFLLFAGQKYVRAGVAIGLSTLSKLSGFFGGLTVVLDWIYSYRHRRHRRFVWTVVAAIAVFIILMVLLNFAIVQKFNSFLNPIARIIEMLGLTGGLTFSYSTHPSKSPPWEWLYRFKTMPFYITPHYTAAVSFSIWVLIIPAFAYLIYRAIKRDEAGIFGLCWFVATYLIWIPITLVTRRVTYIYYFYPAVGAVCLAIGMGLSQLIDIFKNRRNGKLKWLALSIVILVIVAHIVSFLILSPLVPASILKMIGINIT